jgi:hypothetical protein
MTVYIGGVLFSQACRLSCNLCSAPTTIQGSTITTTRATTTASTSSLCVDSQTNCAFWTNFCSLLATQNPHPCRRTCNVCTVGTTTSTTIRTTTTVPCVDSQQNCRFWASYCSLLSGLNPHPCRNTCKICS